MFPKTSVLLVIFLLLSAASLASYLFHQWSVARGGRTLSWAGISLGATLLLAAVVVVVLALSWVSARHWSFSDDSQATTTASAAAYERGWDAVGYVGDTPMQEQRPAEPPPEVSRVQQFIATRHTDAVVPLEPPWAATTCIVAVKPDPADPTRWTFVNGCQRPVAIAVASCALSDVECLAAGSTSWHYDDGEMILPSKLQRTVTAAEEVRRGRRLRYAACFVNTREAIQLIGVDGQDRASISWDDQFATVRMEDECLTRIRTSVMYGSSSGLAVDVPPGRDVPETTP
jgi:hypothetical protein